MGFILSPKTPQQNEPTTISGKPLTFPVAFRLSLADYEQLQLRAAREAKTVAALVQEWVIDRLIRGAKDV